MNSNHVAVRVRGEFACFTRPELKMERVTYPIMTPSAARGILEAIYWHPQFAWQVHSVSVLAPVKTFSLVRNEVNHKMSIGSKGAYFADEDRTQRHSLCLRDVDYIIEAEPQVGRGAADPSVKHREIFNRRVSKGQCFHRPCLGTREFAAEFLAVDDHPLPIDWTEDLGIMLWDIDFSGGPRHCRPLFFPAQVIRGVMAVDREPIGGRP